MLVSVQDRTLPAFRVEKIRQCLIHHTAFRKRQGRVIHKLPEDKPMSFSQYYNVHVDVCIHTENLLKFTGDPAIFIYLKKVAEYPLETPAHIWSCISEFCNFNSALDWNVIDL